MTRLAFALLLIGAAFGAPAQDDQPVPFFTTPDEVVDRMLELAGTRSDDMVVDLGSGDGRIVIRAATKFGAHGLGIELDGGLVETSRENARRAGVSDRVSFLQGDVLAGDFSRATVITVYLLPGLINKLEQKFLGLQPGTRIVSHAFRMTGWRPDRTELVRLQKPHAGQGEQSALYLWIVPADVRGVWRSADSELRISQNFQDVTLEGRVAGRNVQHPRVALEGSRIQWTDGTARFEGRVDGRRILGEIAFPDGRRPLILTRER